jgi:glycosyltransferase involved in cell wall biosynthesis
LEFLKRAFRNIIRPILYWFYYLPFKKKIDVARDGSYLKRGITAVEYTLPFCLQSLINIADQIVIIDNGSTDKSLAKALEFKNQFQNKIQIDIIEMPGALLGDCREAGLKAARYQWHLRWDADMVAKTSGENDILKLREQVLSDNTPRTIQFSRINLYGDFKHALGKMRDPGEPILMWFNKDIYYKEYGKFDTVRVPFYYKQIQETKDYVFHCAGLKSIDNLIHRFHYFSWREFSNTKKINIDYSIFRTKREKYLLGTENKLSIKFRYNRQLTSQFKKIDETTSNDYPEIIYNEIKNNRERFIVEYKDNLPYLRIDREDEEMASYKPTEEDLNWNPADFLQKLFSENLSVYL